MDTYKIHKLADKIWEVAKDKENDRELEKAVQLIKEFSSQLHGFADDPLDHVYVKVYKT